MKPSFKMSKRGCWMVQTSKDAGVVGDVVKVGRRQYLLTEKLGTTETTTNWGWVPKPKRQSICPFCNCREYEVEGVYGPELAYPCTEDPRDDLPDGY